MIRRNALSALALLGLAACVAQGPQPSRESSMAVPQDPDQLAAHALKSWRVDGNTEAALASIERATKSAADRPDLTWLHMRLCDEARG